jgi:hypothetical protein
MCSLSPFIALQQKGYSPGRLHITTAAASSTNINTSPQEHMSQGIECARLAANSFWQDCKLGNLARTLGRPFLPGSTAPSTSMGITGMLRLSARRISQPTHSSSISSLRRFDSESRFRVSLYQLGRARSDS